MSFITKINFKMLNKVFSILNINDYFIFQIIQLVMGTGNDINGKLLTFVSRF